MHVCSGFWVLSHTSLSYLPPAPVTSHACPYPRLMAFGILCDSFGLISIILVTPEWDKSVWSKPKFLGCSTPNISINFIITDHSLHRQMPTLFRQVTEILHVGQHQTGDYCGP